MRVTRTTRRTCHAVTRFDEPSGSSAYILMRGHLRGLLVSTGLHLFPQFSLAFSVIPLLTFFLGVANYAVASLVLIITLCRQLQS